MSRQTLLKQFRGGAPVVVPSMLQCDFGNLEREVHALEAAGAQALHWDVMDGHFVPNLSYGAVIIERLRDRTGLPFDAHLMISQPARYLDEYIEAGCDAVTFHIEAVAEPAPLLKRLQDAGCLAGLALNPDTPVARLEPYLGMLDLVLVMSVQPGFGGQEFRPECVQKLSQLRQHAPQQMLLSVDGGINPQTIGSASAAGADLFVAGSAVFRASDYRSALTQLRDRASEARV